MARKSGNRQTRDKFIILTNGEQSETNYFTILKSHKSIYDVEVKFINADPIALVDNTEKLLHTANQVWCVFDIDYTYKENRLLPALKKARTTGVKIAYSNMAFEVWLISHFQKCEKYLEVKDYAEILTKFLKQTGYAFEYNKSDEVALKKIFIPRYKEATTNAKIVFQKRVKQFRETHNENAELPIWEWNSSTNIFKLIEALHLSL